MRVAEDGVLTDWFRKPHRRFGTSYRIVNLVFALQMFTIIVSRGNVITLGEAYAFGVIWSFTFNSLAMLVLRWKYNGERGWKVPPNIRIGKTEIPVGLFSVFLVLLYDCDRQSLHQVGCHRSAASHSPRRSSSSSPSPSAGISASMLVTAQQMKEHFQLEHQDTISRESLQISPGGVMVTMRDAANPFALKWALSRTNTDDQDVVVLTARMMGAGGPEYLERRAADLQRTRADALHQGRLRRRKLRQAHLASGRSRRRRLRRAGADGKLA